MLLYWFDLPQIRRTEAKVFDIMSSIFLGMLFNVWYVIIAFNPLAPGRSGCDSKNGIFNFVFLIGIFRYSHDALRWMPQDLPDDKSTLGQVLAWCRQVTSHYLSQCWLSSLSPYGVARPEWVYGQNVTYNQSNTILYWTLPWTSYMWNIYFQTMHYSYSKTVQSV